MRTAEFPNFSDSVKERSTAVTNFHKLFVMSAPELTILPQPARIDSEMKSIKALSKNPKIKNLVSSSIGTALTASMGAHRLEFVHEIPSVNDSIIELRNEIADKMKQRPHTLDSLLSAINYLVETGIHDPHSIEKARELLFSYAKTMVVYSPDDPNAEKVNGKKKKLTQTPPIALEKYFAPQVAAVVNEDQLVPTRKGFPKTSQLKDNAFIHGDPKVDTKPITIDTTSFPKIPVVYEREIEDHGTTVRIEVPNYADELNYGVSLVVKENDTWRKVHLSSPVSPDEYNPKANIKAQQYHIWTTDLPTEPTQYAIVVDAAPWKKDVNKREEGTTITTSFKDEIEEKTVVAAFYDALRASRSGLQSAFYTEGLPNGQVRFTQYGAKTILDYLVMDGREDILGTPIEALFKGNEHYTRLSLAYGSRVGFVGNEKPTPLNVLIKGSEGSELISSGSKSDDPKDGKKEIKDEKVVSDEKDADRKAIMDVLGIDESGDLELFIFDEVGTHRDGGKYGKYSKTSIKTRTLHTQPVAMHEVDRQDGKSKASTLIQVTPYVTTRERTDVVSVDVESTVEDLLEYVARGTLFSLDQYQPQARLRSKVLVSAIERAKREQEALNRRLVLVMEDGCYIEELRALLPLLYNLVGEDLLQLQVSVKMQVHPELKL